MRAALPPPTIRMSALRSPWLFLLLATVCLLTTSNALPASGYPNPVNLIAPINSSLLLSRATSKSRPYKMISNAQHSNKLLTSLYLFPNSYNANGLENLYSYNEDGDEPYLMSVYFYKHLNSNPIPQSNETSIHPEKKENSLNKKRVVFNSTFYDSSFRNLFALDDLAGEILREGKKDALVTTKSHEHQKSKQNFLIQGHATEEYRLFFDSVEFDSHVEHARSKRELLNDSTTAAPFGPPTARVSDYSTTGIAASAGNENNEFKTRENGEESARNWTDAAENGQVSQKRGSNERKGDDSLYSDREQLKVLLARLELDCRRKMLTDPPPETGCARVWDQALCWEPTHPNSTSQQPCPVYIVGMENDKGFAFKRCDADGHWARKSPTPPLSSEVSGEMAPSGITGGTATNGNTSSSNISEPIGEYIDAAADGNEENNTLKNSGDGHYINDVGWTDYSQCLRHSEDDEQDLSLMLEWLPFVKRTSLIGYSISLITLTISFIILASLKKLRCPRNLLHLHLFASFILRATVVLLRSSVLASSFLTPAPALAAQPAMLKGNDTWWCRLMIAIWQYFITANYSWILMEGLYLHNLIFRALFTDSSAITLYVLLGWGLPLLLVGSWASVRAAVDDSHCWMLHSKPWIFMALIRVPVAFSVFLNFFFFINIVRVLTMKLRSSVSDENMKYRKLAKSTLVLVPLFGVHYCLLWGLSTSRHPTVELAWLVMDQVFASFQGFFVAVLYCLMNGEVRQEMRKMYYNRFGGGDHTFFNTGQSTMISHTRVYTSWWAKIRSRLLLCCRATRTSIHSLHSMTDRRDRQSPSPKLPKKPTEQACGNCINTNGNNTGNNCSDTCHNHNGNSCSIECGNDCQKCGEGATLVRPSCYSLLPAPQPRLQEDAVEELIELQERNHVSPSSSPTNDAQGDSHAKFQIESNKSSASQNSSLSRYEAGSLPTSSSYKANNLQINARQEVTGDTSLTSPGQENELLCLIPNQDAMNCDENPDVKSKACENDDNIHQKSSHLKNHSDTSDITNADTSYLVGSRSNIIQKKEDRNFKDSRGEDASAFHEPLGVWKVGVNKDGVDAVLFRNSRTPAQELNPLNDPMANLENERKELFEGQNSPRVNTSEIFDDHQLQGKVLSPQIALGDIPIVESDSAKKKERPSKVKYCGESNIATTVIASEDENKEDKDETML